MDAAAADLTGLAALLLAAMAAGWALSRAGQPVSPGYLLAGILCGPSVLAFVAHERAIRVAAEASALVLLFIVAIELSVRALRAERRAAITAAGGQIVAALIAMLLVAWLTDITAPAAVTIGFAAALASPSGMTELLNRAGAQRARAARVAVATLIAGTLAFLPMSVIADSIGHGTFGFWALVKALLGIGLVVVIGHLIGGRRRYHLPFSHLAIEHAELSPLAALAYGFAGALVFGLLGLTAALGAFAAGLLLSGSLERGVFASALGPLRAAAKLLFFVAFGALVDLGYVLSHLFTILLGLIALVSARLIAGTALLHFAGAPWPRAFAAAAALWPAGETSFLLIVGAFSVYSLSIDEAKFALALIAATVLLSPAALAAARRLRTNAEDVADWRDLIRLTLGGTPPHRPAAPDTLEEIGAQVREAVRAAETPPPYRSEPHA